MTPKQPVRKTSVEASIHLRWSYVPFRQRGFSSNDKRTSPNGAALTRRKGSSQVFSLEIFTHLVKCQNSQSFEQQMGSEVAKTNIKK